MSQVTNHNEERQEDRSSVHTKLPENNYKKEKKNFSGLDYVLCFTMSVSGVVA